MFTSLPRVTPPGEMRDGRCEVPPGGRQPFSHCCHDDAGCRELPGPRSYPSQRQRLVSAVGPPPRPVHSGGPEGSAGLHHGSAPSFSLGQCWSRALPLHLCPRPRLRVCRSQGTKPKTTGEANAGQQRVSILSTLPSDPGELRESPQDCDIFLLPSRRAKPKIGRGCPLRCLFSLRDQGPERGFRVAAPQPAANVQGPPSSHRGPGPQGMARPSPLSTRPGPLLTVPPSTEERVLPASGGLPSSHLQTASFPRSISGSPSRPSAARLLTRVGLARRRKASAVPSACHRMRFEFLPARLLQRADVCLPSLMVCKLTFLPNPLTTLPTPRPPSLSHETTVLF